MERTDEGSAGISDADHENALRAIEALWGAEEGTGAGDRLDVLVTLVETYERQRWPIEPLDPARPIERHNHTGRNSPR